MTSVFELNPSQGIVHKHIRDWQTYPWYRITLLVLTYRDYKHWYEHGYKWIHQCWESSHILEPRIGVCKVRAYVYPWPTVLKKPKEPVFTLDWRFSTTQRTGSHSRLTVLKKPKELVLTLDSRFSKNPKELVLTIDSRFSRNQVSTLNSGVL
jgi:hypothetical protein